jgi:hypothetical protein
MISSCCSIYSWVSRTLSNSSYLGNFKQITEEAVITLKFAVSWSKSLSISASSDRSFTSNFDLLDAVLQFIEAVNVKQVDMSTSSVICEVAGVF